MAQGVADINLSDHQLIYVQRKKRKMPTKKVEFLGRSYRHYDNDVFRNELVELNWEEFYASTEVDDLWNIMLANVNHK